MTTQQRTSSAALAHPCRHEVKAHRNYADFLHCTLLGKPWIRDEASELEFAEYHSYAVIWCHRDGYSLFPVESRAIRAAKNPSLRLCPANERCIGDHAVTTLTPDLLASTQETGA